MLRIIINLSKINILSENRIKEKLLVFILPIIILGFTESIIPSLMNILFCIFMINRLEIPFKIYRRFIRGVSLFIIMGMIPLLLDGQMNKALTIIFRSISSVSSIFLFSTTTPLEYIFYEFHKINFLKEFSEIARTMIRFLIMIEDEYRRIRYAMESRLGFSKNSEKIKNYAKLLGVLFINSMMKWKDIENSLISRGYRGELKFSEIEKRESTKLLITGFLYNSLLLIIILKG
ncbi:MAG: CbiQ family ECF transporter T component [Andreesenia angusta]|nr:CbiQ family ECF transporter T component [Andreesenia angusta]